MAATLSIRIKGLKDVYGYFDDLSKTMPKAGKEATVEIADGVIKHARMSLSHYTKLTPQLRKLIYRDSPRKIGGSYTCKVIAEDEAVFWEYGVRPHKVAFFSQGYPSWVDTPRDKFRSWAYQRMGISRDKMKELGAITVHIPRTMYLRKAYNTMNRKAGAIVSKHIRRAGKGRIK